MTTPFAGMTQSRFTGVISALTARAPRCRNHFLRPGRDVKPDAPAGRTEGIRQRIWNHG
jgi:hypothetical protein